MLLRELRKARGLTQLELARRTGIAQPKISRLEHMQRETVSLEALDRLCAVLKCQPGDLLRYEPKRGKGRGK